MIISLAYYFTKVNIQKTVDNLQNLPYNDDTLFTQYSDILLRVAGS
jgi:hypothetical protein